MATRITWSSGLLCLCLACLCLACGPEAADGAAAPDKTAAGADAKAETASDVQARVRQKADDVASSESFITTASFHFDRVDDQLTGTASYRERSTSGAEVCSTEVQLHGTRAAVAGAGDADAVAWSHRFKATGGDASACRFPLKWLSFIAGSDGVDGIFRLTDDVTVGPVSYEELLQLGSEWDDHAVLGEAVAIEGGSAPAQGQGAAPEGYSRSEQSLDFQLQKTTHVPTIGQADCAARTGKADLSAVVVDAPLTGALACSKDGMRADLWSVTLQAGQSLRAAVIPRAAREALRFTLLSPDGCRQVHGRRSEGCPDGHVCSTVKHTVEAAGEYTLLLETGIRCGESSVDYELHVELH